MALFDKIDSNVTGLSLAREATPGVLPGTPTWIAMQPNSYGNLGGSLTKTARSPISLLRQNRKGTTTDLDAAASFDQDITLYSFQDLWPALFLAEKKTKPVSGGRTNTQKITAVSGTAIDVGADAATLGFEVGMIVHTEFFTNAANNTLNSPRVITAVAGNDISLPGLTTEASPPGDAVVRAVGFEFSTGDATLARPASDFPQLTSAADLDFDTLAFLIPGETIVIGQVNNANSGDVPAGQKFDEDGNNGKFRIREKSGGTLIFDLADGGSTGLIEPTAATGTAGKTIRIYWADVTRNVSSDNADFSQITFAVERSLGAPDDAALSEIQAETVTGALWNGAGIRLPTADKMTIDSEWLATENTNFTGGAGDERPTNGETVNEFQESDAFNTTDNVPDIRIFLRSADPAVVVPGSFFAFVANLTMNVSNNATALKAIGRLGAFAVTAGNFTVSSEMSAYFQTTTALQSVRDNDDVGMFAFADLTVNGRRAALMFDLPFGSTSTEGLNVSADNAITVPLTLESAVDPVFGFTMIVHEFWFLPN